MVCWLTIDRCIELLLTNASNDTSVDITCSYTWFNNTTAMATRGWQNKKFHELNNGLVCVFYNFIRFMAVLGKTSTWNRLTLTARKKKTPMSNYSRFLPWNCRPHSHATLEEKSGTVSDNEDIEPLVYFFGETKVNFERCFAKPRRRDTLKSCSSTL